MVEASIHLRLLCTSILDIGYNVELLLCCVKGMWVWVHPYAIAPAKRYIDLGILDHLWSKNDAIKSWMRPISTYRLLSTSILDIFKVFELLVCCLKGIHIYPYVVTQDKLVPDLGLLGLLWSGNDSIRSWLRLVSHSNHLIHPYWTYKKSLSNWCAVSRADGCSLMPIHWPRWFKILGFLVTCCELYHCTLDTFMKIKVDKYNCV